MAAPHSLQTQNIPPSIREPSTATPDSASPARGKAMVAALHRRLRPTYPLVHGWDFWHDRQNRKAGSEASTTRYEDRLVKLHSITDVKHFWELYNNFDLSDLPLRDSVHLFKQGVKPLWEDARNVRGGAWTFRVPKERAGEFWQHVSLLAIGEKLQDAVSSSRTTFVDDICGLSYSVRFNSVLITIWNRDADHAEGIQRILDTTLENMPEGLVPSTPTGYYYKKHSEHSGFTAPGVARTRSAA
ncbi:translation initiation factor eIF4e [Trichodelitschia bisporula]|uniref:Translation initiation factor eIF4e n=1 Tax=Trichodelitschia bisporula TaxID=703511 RepID=A0A6G1HRJ1_9PEZI|nr:translation initiation factor eIF4e [Trichodelitschia bisporula]